jgi:hypothetical protein
VTDLRDKRARAALAELGLEDELDPEELAELGLSESELKNRKVRQARLDAAQLWLAGASAEDATREAAEKLNLAEDGE